MEQDSKHSKKLIVAFFFATIMILSSLVLVTAIPVGQEYVGMPQISGISNNIGQSINVTFSRVSYTNEPTQWQVGPATPQNGTYQASKAWILNNSGYQIIQQNTTSPTAPSFVTYNFSADNGSLKYFYMDQRLALNGSAKAYIDIAETNITGLPGTTGALASAAGKAQNQLNINITHVATGYNLTVGYFAYNSKGYENYTTVSMSPAKTLLPLVFYEIGVYATPTLTKVYLFNTMTGAAISSVSFNATINGNLSKMDHVAYELDSSGALVLSFAYYLNHNTYPSSASVATSAVSPFIAATDSSITTNLPFDPSSTNTSYTQGPTSTSDYRGTTGSINDFSSVINANDASTAAASLINRSKTVTTTVPLSNYGAGNITNTLRTTNTSGLSFSASIHVNGWNTTDIMEALQNYLQGYLYQDLGSAVFPSGPKQVDITYYVITSISVNLQFGSGTASSLQSSLDTAIPGILASHKLSIVDKTTGAVAAGEYAGDFIGTGVAAVQDAQGTISSETVPVDSPAIASAAGIMNPFTNIIYPSLQAAGFPEGSYIQNGHVVVPQIQFFGFTSQGQPIFNEPLSLVGQSGAALAAQGYFHSALPTVYNAANTSQPIASPYTLQAQIGASSHAISGFVQDTLTTAQNYLPFMGATIANIGASISTSYTGSTTVGNLGHSLLSTTSQTVGALLAGASSSNTYIYRIGTSFSQLPSSFYQNASNYQASVVTSGVSPDFNLFGAISSSVNNIANSVYSTASNVASTSTNSIGGASSNFVNDAQAVVSPVFTTVRNLGTSAINDVKTVYKTANSTAAAGRSIFASIPSEMENGAGALNRAGSSIAISLTSNGSKIITATTNTAGKISSYIAGDASFLSNAAHGTFSWVTGIFNGAVGWIAKYWIVIVVVIVSIIILAIVVLSILGKHRVGVYV